MLPRMRALTWLVVAYNALLAVAMVGGVRLSGHAWFLGNMVLGVLWVASHPRRRTCPQCSSELPRTFLVCTVRAVLTAGRRHTPGPGAALEAVR
jgi:hypothetical protein